jgi:hypothetical protein
MANEPSFTSENSRDRVRTTLFTQSLQRYHNHPHNTHIQYYKKSLGVGLAPMSDIVYCRCVSVENDKERGTEKWGFFNTSGKPLCLCGFYMASHTTLTLFSSMPDKHT